MIKSIDFARRGFSEMKRRYLLNYAAVVFLMTFGVFSAQAAPVNIQLGTPVAYEFFSSICVLEKGRTCCGQSDQTEKV